MHPTVRDRRDHYSRTEFLRSAEALESSLEGAEPTAAAGWRARLAELRGRLDAREARVAVVGPVKSGKSTLVNALLGTDLLPRGSGVLTAQVTQVRRGPRPQVSVDWISAGGADATFSRLLGLAGTPGSWRLADGGHRRSARQTATRSTTPAAAAVLSLLDGYEEAAPRLGRREADLPLPADGVSRWAARDEAALYLRGLRVTTPSASLPEGLVLLDCQGYDAWNPCHAADLLAALQTSDAVVYVVSSRVGFRDADQRLLEQLQGLGLLPLTRFVLNVDWGELRSPEELRRVRQGVGDRVAALGAPPPAAFSALQGLLDHLSLVAPEALTAGEQRLLSAWDADCSAGMAAGREAFRSFCNRLWHDATEERDAVVLRRLRLDLRRLMVDVATALRRGAGAGLRRVAWADDAADRVLHWAQERLARAGEGCRRNLLQKLQREFAARRAPQRVAWQRAVAAALEQPGARTDPLGTALGELPRSEPLRINGLRNLALEVRGELSRQTESLALEMASRLAQAGLDPAPPPSRVTLSRELAATRRIPLFSRVAARVLGGDAPPEPATRRGLLARLSEFGRPAERAVAAADRVGQGAQRALVTTRLGRAWEGYLEQVREDCLLPHVEEAAADLYTQLAGWVLDQLHHPEGSPGALGGDAHPDPASQP